MNTLENSLCGSCEHLIYCCLTNDKSAIWSCSEYEVSGDHDQIFQEKLLNQSKDISASNATEEVFF
ncbi:hypothetical protein MWU76_09570 [Gelidibacter sp. F2691]|nr:hypothetical protein [Gelidibacter sp. F2691]